MPLSEEVAADYQTTRLSLKDHPLTFLRPLFREEGVLSAAAVQPLWQQFLGGQRKWHTHLWNVLMFQAWQAHWRQVRAGIVGG